MLLLQGKEMNALDKVIINNLQEKFPVCEKPFSEISKKLNIEETVLINRIQALLDNGTLSRFGPLFNIEELGGIYCLVAMRVPEKDLDDVITLINAYPEVAHNYEREHEFNIWFVLATESVAQLEKILDEIEKKTGYKTYDMPKLEEFYVGLKLDA